MTNYIREDANSLDGYTGKAAQDRAPPVAQRSSCPPHRDPA